MSNFVMRLSNPRVAVALLYDMIIACFAFWCALYLRYGTLKIALVDNITFNRYFFVSMAIHLVAFMVGGLYKGVWRFSSTYDLFRVIRASLIAVCSSLVVCFFMTRLQGIPRTMFVIEFLLLVIGLGGGRLAYRYFKDNKYINSILKYKNTNLHNVLIVGAGRAGEKLLRDISITPSLGLNVVGFLDDDKYKKNAFIHNKKVFGSSSLIPEIVKKYHVSKVFIAIPSAESSDVKRIGAYCMDLDVEVKILPKMNDYLANNIDFSQLRNINIEDVLGRMQVQLDMSPIQKMITNRVIMVTGAGGSIGSELCFQIAKFNPKQIVLCDFCELFMYELEMKFRNEFPHINIVPKILDIRDERKVENTFIEYNPELVFHAAAYKHVPMMEHNPYEAVETNINGTRIVASLAMKYKVKKFVMISTDKAVNPTNVMGASKRVAEMVITDLSQKSDFTQFISVRFGNVLGSNGSVIPLFKKQIEDGRDITVTHPDIIRYFMSIPEAAQLVLQSASMGSGGEIFVLDMGEPVKIVDLAKTMIRIAGLREGRDINIVFSGLRPGEKLYEELFSDKEEFELTHHGKIRKAKHRNLALDFSSDLEKLLNYKEGVPDVIVHMIKNLVPEFTHFRLKENDEGASEKSMQ